MAAKSKPKKEYGNSLLGALSDAHKETLIQGMIAGWTYPQAQDWLQEECGLVVRSGSSFTAFYRRYVEPILQERKKFAALTASSLGKMARETEAFDLAAIAELKEYAYRLIRDPNTDPEAARKWMETLIKAQAGQRDSRKLSLLEAAAADAKSRLMAISTMAKSKGGISAETLQQIEEAAGLL